MKKNLTFLMMLMAFVGIAFAQSGPKFNYQAVVRHADTLYHNNPVNIEVVIMDAQEHPVLIECHNNKMTTDNGFVSIVIGEGSPCAGTTYDPVDLSSIVWNGAMMNVAFTFAADGYEDEEPVSLSIDVKPVPFALQSDAALLTTNGIANYLQNVPQNEAKQVLDALIVDNVLVDNIDLQEQLEDAIEEYLSSQFGYAIALQVAAYYLHENITPEEAKDYYDALKAKTNVTSEIKTLIKNFVMNTDPEKRQMVKNWVQPEVLYCLGETTLQDAKDVYHALQAIPAAEKQEIKQVVKTYLEEYVQSDDFKTLITDNQTAIVAEISDIVASISKEEALAAWAWLGMTNSDVKTVLRNKLNYYIGQYNLNLTNEKSKMIRVPNCDDPNFDYCALEELYLNWADNN